MRRNLKTKLQGSRVSNPETLQCQIYKNAEKRLRISSLEIVLGGLHRLAFSVSEFIGRQRRHGAHLKTRSRGHFFVFNAL
jgi:hypothetical protein